MFTQPRIYQFAPGDIPKQNSKNPFRLPGFVDVKTRVDLLPETVVGFQNIPTKWWVFNDDLAW